MRIKPNTNKKGRGFTLPEVIVTITLIAALAAVVVPAIASQIKKGDPSRVASDEQAIRGAVEQFLTDVRRYPNSIGQLTNAIAATTQSPLVGSVPSTLTYVTGDASRWRGPYITKDSAGALPTGFNWSFLTSFTVDTLAVSGVTGVTLANGTRYMVLRAPSTSFDNGASALLLDQMYDDGNLSTGAIRYRICTAAPACTGSNTPDTLKFLLMPIS